MLQFYYNPLSPLSRRVWIALLEKEIPFTPITVNLKEGEQFKRDFLAINPFHHVPVIIDDNLRVLKSLLADDAYFGGDTLSVGDIVAGNTIILVSKLGYELSQIGQIARWCDRLMQREVWQQTQPNDEQIEIFKQTVQELIKLQSKNQIISKVKQSS